MSPLDLSVLWQTEGGPALEAALHRRFKSQRVHGEWFDFGDKDPVTEVTAAVDDIRAEMGPLLASAEIDYRNDLLALDEATQEVERLRQAVADAEAEAAAAVAKALKSCIAANRNRTEVQKHSPFSPPTVRKIGEDAGIPPDERYVRTGKPES